MNGMLFARASQQLGRLFTGSTGVYAVDNGSPHHGASQDGPPHVCLARSEQTHGATVDQPRSRQGLLFTPWALQSSRVRRWPSPF